jgi:peptidoglycan/LPS O-acetylase OafA/YrhL
LGYLRLILSFGVVAYHLSPQVFSFAGPAAVFGFYTVSGYLITAALSSHYRGRTIAFLLNRFLRLYPTYWVAVGLAVAAIVFGQSHNRAMTLPTSFDDWWRQIAVFGLLHGDGLAHPIRLVPPAWSLNMELAWYILLISLHRYSIAWLAGSLALAAFYILGGGWTEPYYSFLAPSFCFALGSTCWRLGQFGTFSIDRRAAFALVVGVLCVGSVVSAGAWILYLSSAVTACAILAWRNSVQSKWMRLCGDLSYPVFLCHWQVAAFIPLDRGPRLLVASTVPIVLVSWSLVVCVEHPIALLRTRVRGGQAQLSQRLR